MLFLAGGAAARPEGGAAAPRRVGGPALAGAFDWGTRPVWGFLGGGFMVRINFNESGLKRKEGTSDTIDPVSHTFVGKGPDPP